MLDQAAVLERRRQILRVVLLVMIFATLPFYCLGFFLWATAPDRTVQEERLPSATFTSIGGGNATNTQFPTLSTTLGGPLPTLMPTPFQYNPPIINPPVINPPTATQPFFIPTSTFAPTLTFAPTNTDPPPPSPLPLPSDTPIPIPTSTTAPSLTPLPADPTVPPDILQPPTDTPGP